MNKLLSARTKWKSTRKLIWLYLWKYQVSGKENQGAFSSLKAKIVSHPLFLFLKHCHFKFCGIGELYKFTQDVNE